MRSSAFILAFVVLVAIPQPTHSARVRLIDETQANPETVEASRLEVSFNPSVEVNVHPFEPLVVILRRLAREINQAGGGEYRAWVAGGSSVEIFRSDGSEIDDLRCLEDAGRLKGVTLTVDRPDLNAKILEISEEPSSGAIILTLNNRIVFVGTTGHTSGSDVTVALIEAIEQAGFAVEWVPPYIVVSRDLQSGGGIKHLRILSTDPSINRTDVALQP